MSDFASSPSRHVLEVTLSQLLSRNFILTFLWCALYILHIQLWLCIKTNQLNAVNNTRISRMHPAPTRYLNVTTLERCSSCADVQCCLTQLWKPHKHSVIVGTKWIQLDGFLSLMADRVDYLIPFKISHVRSTEHSLAICDSTEIYWCIGCHTQKISFWLNVLL